MPIRKRERPYKPSSKRVVSSSEGVGKLTPSLFFNSFELERPVSCAPIIRNVSGLLIAGGKSRRMGRDKRFLEIAGQRVFDRTLKVLGEIFSETIVVLAEPVADLDLQGSRVVYDAIPNAGSLGGLYTGLMTSSHQRIFAVACDMPYLNSDVIRFLSSFDITADVVVAQLSGRFQALHALYSRRCVPILKEMAEQRDLKLQRLFLDETLRISIVQERDLTAIDSGLRSFQNINTPEDLASAKGMMSG